MTAESEGTPRRKGVPPTDHNYPYPWVRLRSASAHPFIYKRMVADVDQGAVAGDIVAVYDRSDQFFGHGFYHDSSQIGVRMLSYQPAAIDEAFFRDRLSAVVAWREQILGSDETTNAYRLVHAEGDGLSGLIAERYADWIAIEVFSLGIYRRLDLLKKLLAELTGITQFVVRADERVQRFERFSIQPGKSDDVPAMVDVREHNIRFKVDLRQGHKTGFFCDQRDNRRRLAGYCRGQNVLDICCYTGGFGLYAATMGQAESVIGVDLDETAIELAQRNAKLNQVRIKHVHSDAFSYLRQMRTGGKTYDVIILDPSKFVATREDLDEGKKKYLDLNTLGMSVLKPGGLILTCSCSGLVSRQQFSDIVRSAAGRLRRPLQIIDQTGAGPDHPIMANCPESEYLKAIWARVL